jgi:hypothetical protein
MLAGARIKWIQKNPTAEGIAVGKSKHTMRKLGTR